MATFGQFIGEYIFRKRFKKLRRKKQLMNLSTARSIGIVFKVTDETNYRKLKDFTRQIRNPQRKVLILGFVDRKGIPAWCVEANSGFFFDRQSLNWWKGPKNDYLVKFIDKEFDLLLDLTLTDDFITRYLVGLSRAKFKAGLRDVNRESYLDLMIELKNNAPLEELTTQLIHYLTLLKSK